MSKPINFTGYDSISSVPAKEYAFKTAGLEALGVAITPKPKHLLNNNEMHKDFHELYIPGRDLTTFPDKYCAELYIINNYDNIVHELMGD